VSEFEHLNDSSVRNSNLRSRVIEWPVKRIQAEPQIYCAYNLTREQFLCSHIELADMRREGLPERIAALSHGSKSALWLAPFLGISPNHVAAPIDLVFLDRNNRVLAVVESFPVSQETSPNLPVGTVLALPSQTIASSGTLTGDQLILCSPQKMKLRLDGMKAATGSMERANDLAYLPFSIAHCFPSAPEARVQMTTWEDIRRQAMAAEHARIQASRVTAFPRQLSEPVSMLSQLAQGIAASSRDTLFCWQPSDRRESRRSPRKFLPWVAACFVNQSALASASVRNISLDGMFVSTSERWSLGNIVQVTLKDWRVPSSERSIMVNAMAVRWSNDGVGLRFVFQKPSHGRSTTINDVPLVDVTETQLKHFLGEFKAGNMLSH